VDDLERISHGGYGGASVAAPGRYRYTAGQVLHRHRHDTGYAAVVLTGSYVEAGDTGRHRVTQGDVIVHQRYESHLNRFDAHGSEVLVLPLAGGWDAPVIGRCENIDVIAHLAERSPAKAVSALKGQLKARRPQFEDWPDMLAADLIADPDICIAQWARSHQIHRGSVSRGFRQQFGLTPAGFRCAARAQRAARAIADSRTALAEIALAAGFADQAHMGNAVRRLMGIPPMALRRRTQATAKRIVREAHLQALPIPTKRSIED
jgi:AraC-like DNA-binding protein